MTTALFGWGLLAVAAFFAVRMNVLDRRLQEYRAPGVDPRSLWLVPIRWRAELYTPDGSSLVSKAWLSLAVTLVCAVLGGLLIALAT